MKNRTVLTLAVGAVVAVLALGTTLAIDRSRAPKLFAEGQTEWSAVLAHLEKNESKEAAEKLTKWIEKAEAGGIRSPEAHYNLAIAHWDLKEPGPAASELLKSLLIAQSLSHIARAQSALAGMQRELGVSDGVAKEMRFLARVWLTDNGLTFLAALAFWLTVAIGLRLWKERDHIKLRRALLWATPTCFLLVLAGLGLASRDWNGGYGVLGGADSSIGLFPSPRVDTQEKLLDLPAGTLVHSTGETQNGFLRIDSPVIAWVQQAQIDVPSL